MEPMGRGFIIMLLYFEVALTCVIVRQAGYMASRTFRSRFPAIDHVLHTVQGLLNRPTIAPGPHGAGFRFGD